MCEHVSVHFMPELLVDGGLFVCVPVCRVLCTLF